MNIAFAGLRHDHIYDLYNMAKNHELYTIVGEFEEDAAAREAAIEKGLTCQYKTYDELLSDEKVEVVALGGCYGDRGQMAIDALKAGKHVIADKPLCTKLSELDEIERLAKEKNLKVSCMFTMRFTSKINAVKKLVESGALGEINNVYFGGQHPLNFGKRPMWYFEKGDKHGGVLNDIAIHGIDILNYALGMEVENILSARCWNKFADKAPNFKDSAQMMASAKGGAGILADVSYATPTEPGFSLPYYWQFFIWGTKGMISFSINEEKSKYFLATDKEPFELIEEEVKDNYLTDFYKMLGGDKNVALQMEDVLKATRQTLKIQEFADKN